MTNNAERKKSDSDVTRCRCHRFGAIAVLKGFVTIDEVKAAIMDQVEDDLSGREHRLLGKKRMKARPMIGPRGWP